LFACVPGLGWGMQEGRSVAEAECVGHDDELGGERPLWSLRKATTS